MGLRFLGGVSAGAVITTGLANGSDQSTTLQAAADALAALGGGTLLLPSGTVVGHVTVDASVVVAGRGKYATILQRPANYDGPVVQSTGYTTMIATGGVGTTHDMGCRDLTIDGHRDTGTFTAPIAGTKPVTPTTSTSTTGGTVAAGTQWYRIAPITAAGVGVASDPINQVTTGATSTVTVNWAAVTGATGYVIYGRTFNGTRITSVGAVTTWTDTGALTPITGLSFKRSGNLTAYPAVALYGWRPVVSNVLIKRAPGVGLHSRWVASAPATGATMEAHLRDIHIEDCGTNSLVWEGPHDSVIHNLFAARPGQAGTVTTATTDNVVVEAGAPLRFVSSHAWGQAQYAFALYGQTDMTACQAEGALTAQVLLACSDIHVNGLEVFFPGGATAMGLAFGTSSSSLTNASVYGLHAYGFSSSSGTAVDLTYASTGCTLTGIVDQTTGTPITGSAPADAYMNVRVNGMAGGILASPNLGTAAAKNTGTTSGTVPLLGSGGLVAMARLATGTPDGTKFVRDDGSLAVPSGGGGGSTSNPLAPTGVLAETFPRQGSYSGQAYNPGNNGLLILTAISLTSGVAISNLTFYGVGAFSVPTNWWFGLYDSSRVQLATTAAQGAAAWGATTAKTLAIATTAAGAAASFTPTYTGLHYIGFSCTGTTAPTLAGDILAASINAAAPILQGFESTGRTTPPAFPFTAGALTAGTNMNYATVS